MIGSGVTLSGCVGVCVGVCVACVREKAKSNKLAEMVPSELHDWSIEFHHGDWPLGLNGSLWVTRLKPHTGFISPSDWSVTRDLDHPLLSICICVCLCPSLSLSVCVSIVKKKARLWSSNVFVLGTSESRSTRWKGALSFCDLCSEQWPDTLACWQVYRESLKWSQLIHFIYDVFRR